MSDIKYELAHVGINGANSEEAHAIAHRVHDKIEDTFKEAKHVMVHVNPCTQGS